MKNVARMSWNLRLEAQKLDKRSKMKEEGKFGLLEYIYLTSMLCLCKI